ncbi:ANTAR domain-containing protein [Arthrobacter cheniae]|uniref:ANTAR domain-containing protein n=1 Tax=Arthrobacter cheniae TaxID=1258888 RepID=A0A3A5M978_9MICC|nr:ANTAR domain-containing protein [Arthrobacter cheniae]RJT74875.1 ANTAR domain-containing protein [Arthrobacter cheniae]
MPSPVEPSVSLSGVVSSVEYFIDCPTGTVEHYFADDSYTWSDELYRIHGYERGDIVPTLELGMSHFDPADRDAVRAFWTKVTTTGGPSSVYASLLDLTGRTHKLLVCADLLLHEDEPVGVWALVVDLTNSIHADTHKLANEAVAASALSRAVIEQAKGILMGRTGLNATEAFDRISSYSQCTNRKVVVISQKIIDRALTLTGQDRHQPRDKALLDLFRGL